MASFGNGEFSELADLIYEAAFVPDVWPAALQGLCQLSNSASGSVIIFNEREPVSFAATGPAKDVLDRIVADQGWSNSYSVSRLHEAPPPAFLHDSDFFPPEMLEGDPLRRPILREYGLGGQSATLIHLMTGESVMITFEHDLARSRPSPLDLAALNRFRPHLARAALMAARLRLQMADNTVASLLALGLPAAVVDRHGKVLALSSLMEALTSSFHILAGDRLALASAAAQTLFAEALVSSTRDGVVRSFPISVTQSDGAEKTVMVVHLLPLRRAARELFGFGDTIVVATPLDPGSSAPMPAILTNLFDLTAAEARLATALVSGLSLRQSAERCGLTFGSARTYLERIFRKTGTNRQAQLVAILKSAQPFRPGG